MEKSTSPHGTVANGALAHSATPLCDSLRAAGQWNPLWDPLAELDARWTESFMAMGLQPMLSGVLGIWTTPDAPAPVLARMRAEALKTLADPAVRQRFGSFGLDVPAPGPTPEEMAASLHKDYEATGRVLKSIGYKP